MTKKLKKRLSGIIVSIGILASLVILDKFQIVDIRDYLDSRQTQQETQALANLNKYEVLRVVDGDTFVINYNGEDEKVRLIGVDTPESVHPDKEKNTEFGKEVSEFSKSMLQGKNVELEFDVDERDQYGRLLAYVYLDGQMYNKILLEKGYAKIATYPPNVKYVDDFTALQKEARENKVGLWAY